MFAILNHDRHLKTVGITKRKPTLFEHLDVAERVIQMRPRRSERLVGWVQAGIGRGHLGTISEGSGERTFEATAFVLARSRLATKDGPASPSDEVFRPRWGVIAGHRHEPEESSRRGSWTTEAGSRPPAEPAPGRLGLDADGRSPRDYGTCPGRPRRWDRLAPARLTASAVDRQSWATRDPDPARDRLAHRDLLQTQPAALLARLPHPSRVRGHHPPPQGALRRHSQAVRRTGANTTA